MSKQASCALTLSALLLLAASPIQAQSSAAKPAAAKAETSNRLMTRDELRACMKMQGDIKAKSESLEQRKTALTADKAKIGPANDELKGHREELARYIAAVKAADDAVKAHAERVEVWNVDFKEVEESKMKTAERRKKQLLAEREELDARNKELIAARGAKVKEYDAAVERFNQRAKGVEAIVNDWNQRNEKLADEGDALLEMRANYAADCSNRRFREEDELAIKQGK